MKFHRHLLTLVAAASLAACSSVKLDDQAPVENRTPTSASDADAARNAANASQTRVAPVDVSAGNAIDMSKLPKVVYFDFDSYVVADTYRPVIEANAKVLSADRKRHIAVQGHTDDRGGSEYNLALGQRRAEAVVKSLELLGAQSAQLEAVSFGKERPAVEGETEEAWAKNRRAEIASK